jgi:4-carboxymuconolactone decarboxylase
VVGWEASRAVNGRQKVDSSKREKSLSILSGMLAPETFQSLRSAETSPMFGGRVGQLAMSNVFDELWTDDTFDLRTRSLVTLGILIALRADDELRVHFPAAMRNGASRREIEEVIYQATGYAGFPAANTARRIAEESLRAAGLIE